MKRYALLLALAICASGATIDFESDAPGTKPNGFSSQADPGVTFTDTIGAQLTLLTVTESNNTRGLAVLSDDASMLQIDFAAPISSLSIAFGNDDPGFTSAGDSAWLQLFNGATSLGLISVVMNRDDLMNQTIGWSGTAATQAVFWFGNGSGTPFALAEVVDNITYTSVPEPANWLAAAAGLVLIATRKLRVIRARHSNGHEA